MKINQCLALCLILLTSGCGSDSISTGNTAVSTTVGTTEAAPEELIPAAAGAPILGTFSFLFSDRVTLDSNSGGLSDVAGFTPSAAQASRLVASFVDHPVGLLDRRLTVEVGRDGGPLLAEGVTYALGPGSLRVSYLERTAPTRAEIFDATAGSLTLLEKVAGTAKGGHASFRLNSVRLVSRTKQTTTELNGNATLDF